MSTVAYREGFSRRSFLRVAGLSALASGSVIARAVPARVRWHARADDLLQGAVEIATWIRRGALETPNGRAWLPEPGHPGRRISAAEWSNLHSGGAGVVLFFLQLAQVTGDSSYLQDATAGADRLAATWHELLSGEGSADLSLYTGIAGVAHALTKTWKVTGHNPYRGAALDIASYIAEHHLPLKDRIAWSGNAGISGDGSTILFLLDAATAHREDELRISAQRAGHRILYGTERQPEILYPGFYRGSSGVAYTLSRLHQATQDNDFLDLAKKSAALIRDAAVFQDDAAMIPYRLSDRVPTFYSGYSHGTAGTARLFSILYRIDRDPGHLDLLERLARGTHQGGLLSVPREGNALCQWSGYAGLTDLFTGLADTTGKAEHLDAANQLARKMLRQWQAKVDGDRWYDSYSPVPAPLMNLESGFSLGAAGIGVSLLNLVSANRRSPLRLGLPDNPFFGDAAAG